MTEPEYKKAVQWLVDNATKMGEARAYRTYCEEYRKSLKAILFQEVEEGTMAEREAYAYAHQSYADHLDELKGAVFEDEKLKALAKAAELKIQVWRTEQATLRGAGV